VDFGLISEVAQARPDWHWVILGDEREGQNSVALARLRALRNVHFLGYKSYDALPDYLRGLDVGTLPTLINDYTRSMFPMKYFDYLAAGVPVVATPLDFTRDHKSGMRTAENAADFCAAIEAQLKRGKLTETEIAEAIGENTWDARLAKMLAILGGNA